MQVNVITDKRQEFNGESFYLCGYYYQHNGKRLHRAVWKFHNGDIPKGYHIHHKDGDRSNNNIENLELINGREHLARHMDSPKRKEQARENVKRAIAEAPKWHRSKEGKEWHKQHGKDVWKDRVPITYYCSYCGKPFETRHKYNEDSNRFCCSNHKASFRRRRLRESIVS